MPPPADAVRAISAHPGERCVRAGRSAPGLSGSSWTRRGREKRAPLDSRESTRKTAKTNWRRESPQGLNGGSLYERAVGLVADDKLIWKQPEAGSRMSDWSPDGRFLIYISRGDIWALSVASDSKPLQVTDTNFTETDARVSPDGRWIAYTSNESLERSTVYVQAFPEPGIKMQVSTGTAVCLTRIMSTTARRCIGTTLEGERCPYKAFRQDCSVAFTTTSPLL